MNPWNTYRSRINSHGSLAHVTVHHLSLGIIKPAQVCGLEGQSVRHCKLNVRTRKFLIVLV